MPEAAVVANVIAANVVFEDVRARSADRPKISDLVSNAYDEF